jgi:hypothetical protein
MRDLTDHCMINDTDPNLQIILCNGLQAWFNWPQGFTLQPHEYDSRFHQLITQQNRIRWRQIFHGRFGAE